jgi:hypothetical protein
MEDLALNVQKRASPSLERARVNVAVFEKLGVDERGDLDVGMTGKDRWITVAAYSDSTVGEGTIRLSEDDLAALGVDDGTGVVVKKALPLSDQVRVTAHAAVGQVGSKASGAGLPRPLSR